MERGISHKAIIIGLAPGGLLVRVVSDNAGAGCAGCAIANVCSLQAPVAVPYVGASDDMVGRTAILRVDAPAAPAAMMWLIGIPLIILVLVLCIMISLGLSQSLAAICAIAAAAIWYVVLHRTRGKRKYRHTPEYTIVEIVK